MTWPDCPRAKWQHFADAGCDHAVAESGVNKLLALAALSAPTAPVASHDTRKGRPMSDPAPAAGLFGEIQSANGASCRGSNAGSAKCARTRCRCDTLDALKAAFRAFDGCAIKQTTRNFVFSDGEPVCPSHDSRRGARAGGRSSRAALCGPQREAARRYVGGNRSQSKADAYIGNILPWRPPEIETPTDGEIASCLPFALGHIALAAPVQFCCWGAPLQNPF